MLKHLTTVILFLSISFTGISQSKVLRPVDSGELMQKIQEHYSEEEYDEALILCNQVHSGDSNYVHVLVKKILCHVGLEQYDEAMAVCDKGMAFNPPKEYSTFALNKGYVLNLQGKKEEALAQYKSLKEKFPYHIDVGNSIAYQYINLKKYDSSYAAYKRQAILFPFDARAHLNLGVFAYNEGHLTEAFMALNFVILLDPYSDKAYSVLGLLNEVSNNNQAETTPKEGFDLESDEYDEIDVLIRNFVALSKKYKVSTKSELYLAKQNHLIFSQLQNIETSDYFFSKYYTPFYKKLMEEGKYGDMQHFQLIPSTNEKHKKLVKKEIENLKKFNSWFKSTWYKLNNKINVNYENVTGENNVWYYDSGAIKAIGNYNEDTEKLEGELVSFFDGGQVGSKGLYKNDEKHGEWTFYRENGLLKELVTFSEGKVTNAVTYSEFGEKDEILLFEDDKRNGAFTENYLHGGIYRKGAYKDGKFDGKMTYYFKSGSPEYDVMYSNGDITNTLTEYYYNGAIYRQEDYKDGKSNGNYKLFWPNGNKLAVGTLVNGKIDGKYETFYQNGVLEMTGSGKEGDRYGEWKNYHRNGKLMSINNYENGKLEGEYKEYDYDGIIYSEKVFSDGYLIAYKYFDKNKKLLAEGGDKKKVFELQNFHPNGTLSSKGKFQKGVGKVGKWQEFDEYGNLVAEYNVVEGDIEGEMIRYFPWGSKSEVINFKKGQEDGLYTEYYPYDTMETEGYYVEGVRSGVWKDYHPNGNVKYLKFYQNGKISGDYNAYDINGKISSVSYYELSMLNGVDHYDTSGNILNSVNFKSGAGTYLETHYNGKEEFKGGYILNDSYGEYIWKYPDGTIETKRYYQGDKKDSLWQQFHENGKLSEEGTYLNDRKEGEWVQYFEDGKVSETSNYIGGLIHGKNLEYYKNGVKSREANFEFGKKHGDYIFYDEAGEAGIGRTYKYDIYDSYWYYNGNKEKVIKPIKNGSAAVNAFYANGKPSRQFTLKNGYFIDDYKIFHSNGNLIADYQLKYDQRHGKYKEYFPSSKLKHEKNYFYGLLHGKSVEFYESGKQKSLATYQYGILHGPSIEFNEDGSKKKETIYYNGKGL